ncbi:uncharacterized protein LOC129743346 [Uranotaenia lowii]|uniref:uncharacterized protein LOC129743346 n=1 Tax=Uranotaenia lowii TaxID=190385 RepID=UPI00247977D3|nr:uncharacterized protein LOC129743346 [Uranotaenia lowii]
MSTDDLRLLGKQERVIRCAVINIKDFVESCDVELNVRSLEMSLQQLDELRPKFIDLRMRTEVLLDAAADDFEELSQSSRDEEYTRVIMEFEKTVLALKNQIFSKIQSLGAVASKIEPANIPHHSKVKLPELKLPTFSGRIAEWITFRDTYKNLIHNDVGLSDIDKFTYLRTSLTGDALQEIASIEISSANYAIAWAALESVFENKKLLVMTHLDSLFALEPLRHENFDSLNKLVNGFEQSLQMLKKIGEEVEGWSTLLQYMLYKRLHPSTTRLWESHFNSKEVPKYSEMIAFLKSHCIVLQSVAPVRSTQPETRKFRTSSSYTGLQPTTNCPFCKESAHSAFKCSRFSKMSIGERVEAVKRNSLCFNCLSPQHIARSCTRGKCQHCGQHHHSLLHANSSTTANQYSKSTTKVFTKFNQPQNLKSQTQPNQSNQTQTGSSTNQPTQIRPIPTRPQNAISIQSQNPATDIPSTSYPTFSSKHCTPHNVLLSTAVVRVADQFGKITLARALLDSGSQRCYMSEKLFQMLQFERSRENLSISGIGGSRSSSTQVVFAEIGSRMSDFSRLLKFHVLPQVAVNLPAKTIDICKWNLPVEIQLADPSFNESQAIDMIIGAEIFFDLLLRDDQMKLGEHGPTLQNTYLGWIIAGGIPEEAVCLLNVPSDAINRIEVELARFFELESCRTNSTLSLEESACETHFVKTTTRGKNGRFVVQLPKKPFMVNRLGESKARALRRFGALERRLSSDPVLKQLYTDFIDEYLRMNHMRKLSPVEEDDASTVAYYLPHQPVFEPDSTTTKLRVVFDASAATSSGVSLNETLMVGPTVQEDLFSIMLRFRLRKYAITGDIEKMYRMIDVDPIDHNLQRIFWRSSITEPIRTFVLTTVTYGTSPAPYLATRCLKMLADENESTYPHASDAIHHNFYVDDALLSVDSLETGNKTIGELIALLGSAGMNLRKISSNCVEILDFVPPYLRDERLSQQFQGSGSVKTLGLTWQPRPDIFRFVVLQWNNSSEMNKRIILSDLAKLFDPLGLVGPVIVQAKIFLQDLWKSKLSWEEILPEESTNWWLTYRRNLEELAHLEVPRWVAFGRDTISVELHSFCDASEKAYGACVYLRCTSFSGEISVSLLTAKSRVAPLDDLKRKRKKTTIPRLELSSALTCAHLFEKVNQSIKITSQHFFWTDSMIVKCWLSSPPSRWDTFVANRVSEIQHTTRSGIWNHVAGCENPADVLSRGATPEQLSSNQGWWQGPPWLQLDRNSWPKSTQFAPEDFDITLLEERTVSAPAQIVEPNSIFALRESLSDLIRLTALMLRYVHNLRNRENHRTGFLSFQKREEALLKLVSLAQQESYPEEIEELKKSGSVKSSSKIKNLTPRLSNGLLVVGGRLRNAELSVGRKHPFILSNHHPLTETIVAFYHLKYLHAGQELVISSLRERFWPVQVRNLVRRVIHRCIKCYRVKPKVHEQLMGDLPPERVVEAPVFQRVGVDYCGPFSIQYPQRKARPVKCFLAVFVCLVVKAVHLEIVGDLTSNAFIAALRRFVGRRGRPEIIMCDNATNFQGARRELDELRVLFNTQEFAQNVAREAAADNINFKFIPRRTPNFGGLWESAVKSVKAHLKRTIGITILKFDEFFTLVVQIEACLNSRPLTPLSNDPEDFTALTPGHFITARPLMALPEPFLGHLNETTLSRWQRVQNFLQHIWSRWSKEYLANLQTRNKWSKQRDNLVVGTLVLLREDNVPPLKWLIGRVKMVYFGNDGNVRVVKVQTQNGEFTRGIAKICILPISDNVPPPQSTPSSADVEV